MTALDPRAEHRQAAYAVRFDWGPTGAGAIAEGADVAVVVDVLSFTTTLTVAVERGIEVWPFPWKDERAPAYAEERDAALAVGRRAAREAAGGRDQPQPRRHGPPHGCLETGAPVAQRVEDLCRSRRRRGRGGRRLPPQPHGGRPQPQRDRHGRGGRRGERWPDGSLRPCAEDLWGAGATIAALVDLGATDLSPEARVAEAAFRAVAGDVPAQLRDCAGGRELTAAGFGPDVAVAAELDVTDVVPVLAKGRFTP